MIIFNYLNSLIFYSLVIVTVGFIGLSVCYSIKNGNDNVTDRIVDTSSNNINSNTGTQTEEPSSSVAKINASDYVSPIHELKYRELLNLLSTEMHKRGINELCLQYLVYSYPIDDLNSSNINEIIISRFCERFYKI